MEVNVEYIPNSKQKIFHKSNADEVVYGGAKGGGKSCALVMEALAYALEHPKANMYIFRETYDDLEANIIREWKEKVPSELYTYNASKHQAKLINGTSLKFRYIRNYSDAEGYQGRSMDWVGIDELTKHEKRSVQVILSCLRSPKGYPPRFRGTCNPGGIGHVWVKEDYIDSTNYGKEIIKDKVTGNLKQFIPATVYDNDVLMDNDPNYVKRLENLPEREKQAFLHGNWNIIEGRFFTSFKEEIHVINPIDIPKDWKRYISLDYGLDMLSVLWFAIDNHGTIYVYREFNQSDIIISEAAEYITRYSYDENIRIRYAPGDLWNRRQETGRSAADIFAEHGVILTKASRAREAGCYAIKELLKPFDIRDQESGKPRKTSKIKIFNTLKTLKKHIKIILADEKNPNVYATEPHYITHIIDALRYFCVNRVKPTNNKKKRVDSQYNTFVSEVCNW